MNTMLSVNAYLLSIFVLISADKDPLEFDFGSCVKIFYSSDHVYNIYCLDEIDNAGTMGIVTDRNHTILFKKISDIEDKSKSCLNIHTEHSIEKHCIDAIQYNCLSEHEDTKKDFMETAENVPCNKVNLEETQLSCMGVKNHHFTLIVYCYPIFSYIRRTVFYIPNNKPPDRQ